MQHRRGEGVGAGPACDPRCAAQAMSMAAALLALLCLRPAAALDAERPLTEFTIALRDSSAGLPHNMVMAMAQTPDGYLWAGTWEGLARYDGIEFRVFDRANTPELNGNGVRALAVARDGGLWVGTARGGLLRFNAGRWQRFARETGFAFDEIMALFEDSRGALWVAGEEAGALRMDAAGITRFGRAEGLGHNTVYQFAEAPDGGIYVAHGAGLDRIDGDRVQPFGREHGLPAASVRAMQIDSDGGITLSSGWRLWRYDGVRFARDPRQSSIGGEITTLGRDRDGNLWVGTIDAGLWRLGARGAEMLDSSLGLPQNRMVSWLEDREGSVWLGTSAGLAQLKDLPFAGIDRRRGLADDYVRAVTDDAAGAVWFATSGGLARLHHGALQRWQQADGLPSESLLSLAEDAGGALWIGSYGAGVARMVDGRIEPVPGTAALADRQIRAMLPRADGSVWIGTNAELAHWQAGELRSYTTADGLPRNYVMALAAAPDGDLWIGTSNGLARYDGERFEKFDQSNGFPARDVFSLHMQGDGTLWAGTNDGLVRGRDGRFASIGVAQGLPHNAIFQIVDDGAGALWMCSNKGAFRVARAQAERAADDPTFRLEAQAFDHLDGMSDTQCNGGSQSAAIRAADGRLWFATASGASVIDPLRRLDISGAAPPVAIESVAVDGVEILPISALEFESGPRKLEIRYAGLSLRIPERVRYRHRLVGYETEWVNSGSARLATYTNLAAGPYRFEVIASNGGAWSEAAAMREFTVVPRYWETTLFRGAVLLAAALLAWAGLRWRINRARQNEQHLAVLVAERTRDLADQADRLALADKEKSQLLEALRQQAEALARLASEDSLTGLPNRREFDARLAVAFERARREHTAVAVAMADVDHFKPINDSFSHAVGDEVLRRLAHTMRRFTSPEIFIARYGGEEFALLFTGSAALDAAATCERLRAAVETLDLHGLAPGLRATVSLGLVHHDGSQTHHEKLVSAADAQLYAAKHAGRNRVSMA